MSSTSGELQVSTPSVIDDPGTDELGSGYVMICHFISPEDPVPSPFGLAQMESPRAPTCMARDFRRCLVTMETPFR
ncbi:hypothetical protein FRB96_009589 [Tulasnella sp. 330]|nr:hypothetical protein FRB96_009589 [Tulasnella sp. 330]